MSNYLPAITHVKIVEEYVLQISFNDGSTGNIDLLPYLEVGVLMKLKDPLIFAQVKLAFGTLEWPGGIDLDPEWLYLKVHNQNVADNSVQYDI